ncbi:MAG: hypothetical protein AAGH64_10970 [Planctomycetota bacterium]
MNDRPSLTHLARLVAILGAGNACAVASTPTPVVDQPPVTVTSFTFNSFSFESQSFGNSVEDFLLTEPITVRAIRWWGAGATVTRAPDVRPNGEPFVATSFAPSPGAPDEFNVRFLTTTTIGDGAGFLPRLDFPRFFEFARGARLRIVPYLTDSGGYEFFEYTYQLREPVTLQPGRQYLNVAAFGLGPSSNTRVAVATEPETVVGVFPQWNWLATDPFDLEGFSFIFIQDTSALTPQDFVSEDPARATFRTLSNRPLAFELFEENVFLVADYDGDGDVDDDDVSAFLTDLANDLPETDFDGNGELDFFDLANFLDAVASDTSGG